VKLSASQGCRLMARVAAKRTGALGVLPGNGPRDHGASRGGSHRASTLFHTLSSARDTCSHARVQRYKVEPDPAMGDIESVGRPPGSAGEAVEV
jgi:hypothetical protein